MIERDITPCLTRLFGQYPFVTVTGPRQSGKTTLCRTTFPHLEYVNLELPDQREFAQSDPRGFLSRLDNGAIIDEIQRVPELLSYLQVSADEKGQNGLFVLTGSEHFQLSESISQSLAGRTGLLHLLPFSLSERQRMGASNEVEEILYSGFYPRIHDQGIEPQRALADYFGTYIERDVRRLSEIRNLSTFQRFVRLCAGRVGQLTDLVALGADAGVSHTTARSWVNVLEASFIVFRLQPFHANIRKRMVKSPKLYFYDVGLASHLLGIERADQLFSHPLRGALFENMVVVEALKYRYNLGRSSNLFFFRDSRGLECDLLFETAGGIGAVEIKSGATVASNVFDSLNAVAKLLPDIALKIVVYSGRDHQSRSAGEVTPFGELCDVLERFEVNKDIATFVQEKLAAVPAGSDINILDCVYGKRIRPVLNEVETRMKQFEPLFRNILANSCLMFGGNQTNSSSLLEARHWQGTMDRHIGKHGFALSTERPLEITHKITCSNYISGPGNVDFSIVVSFTWVFDKDGFSQSVSVADAPVHELADRILYAELDTHTVKVARTGSAVLKAIKNEMEHRLGAG